MMPPSKLCSGWVSASETLPSIRSYHGKAPPTGALSSQVGDSVGNRAVPGADLAQTLPSLTEDAGRGPTTAVNN